MSFLYFIPDVDRETFTADHIRAAGLADTLRDLMSPNDVAGLGGLVIARVIRGPKGHAGIILQAGNRHEESPQAVGYFPDRQEWIDCGRYWIGHDREHLPTPEQLQRTEMFPGPLLTLADGRQWEVPVIRLEAGKHRLPDTWSLADGKVVSTIRPEWQWAWELAGRIWQWHTTSEEISKETAFAWCVELLGINYRISQAEANILAIIGSQNFHQMLDTAVAGALLEEYRHARELAGVS